MRTARLAEGYAHLWGATGGPRYRRLAEQIANTVTWLQMSDGKMRIGLWWHAQGTATSGIIFTDQFLRIMSEIPETAPRMRTIFCLTAGMCGGFATLRMRSSSRR